MAESAVLFCPFCRESFEGPTRCPEHDLTLVPWDALPPETEATPDELDREALPFWDPRYGRGVLFLAELLVMVGFFSPLFRTSLDERSATGFVLASTRAPNFWIVPATALAVLSILARRPTPRSLRSARLSLVGLSLVAATSLTMTSKRVWDGAHAVAHRMGHVVEVTPMFGFWLVVAGLALALVAAMRAGVLPTK